MAGPANVTPRFWLAGIAREDGQLAYATAIESDGTRKAFFTFAIILACMCLTQDLQGMSRP